MPPSHAARNYVGAVVALSILLSVFAAGCQLKGGATPPDWLHPARVAKHVDGDTIRVTLPDGTEEPVRLIGIDTPEDTNEHEEWGREASEFTRGAAPIGTRVYLEYDVERRDRHGRLLAYVWLEATDSDDEPAVRATMLNARIALAGLASPLTVQPNSKYHALFAAYVSEARRNEVGMWDPGAQPAPVR